MADQYQHLRERGLTQESVYRGQFLKVRVDTVALPDGEIANREIVDHPGAVAVLALNAAGEVMLVRQFRYAINRITLELPAGKRERGETPEATCRRELAEETGFHAEVVERVLDVAVSPGYSNEIITLFRATELVPVPTRPDADEFLEAVSLPLDEALAMIRSGEIQDAKTIVGLLWLARA